MTLKPLVISPERIFLEVFHPAFADIPTDWNGNYPNTLHEWTLYDQVDLQQGQSLMDIYRNQNFLQRKDASCKTIWKPVATTGNRKLYVTPLYAANENCQEEFFKDSLKAFRGEAAMFRDMILKIFKQGMTVDMLANGYFGDTTRNDDATGIWSWNKYDGVFTKIAKYITDSTIPASQVLSALPDGVVSPSEAYDILKAAYDAQSEIMSALPDNDKAFYVGKKLAKAYERYLISIGGNANNGVMYIMNGIPSLNFEGIPIYVEPLWDSIMTALNGGTLAHACILTIRGNFCFGTNRTYGGGPDLDRALRVWWSDDDEVWRTKADLVAGTEIAFPEHVVFGMTNVA